jgi:hypothetical protein
VYERVTDSFLCYTLYLYFRDRGTVGIRTRLVKLFSTGIFPSNYAHSDIFHSSQAQFKMTIYWIVPEHPALSYVALIA